MRILCRPCAEDMKKQGMKLKKKPLGMNKKITCDRCGRRRYGNAYEDVL